MEQKITPAKLVTLLLDDKGKPISLNEASIYNPEEIVKKLRSVKPTLYNVLVISLATARTGVESEAFPVAGDFFTLQDISGAATAKVVFNEPDKDKIDLSDHLRILIPFYRFFIVNTAQAGETLTIIVGRESLFTLNSW